LEMGASERHRKSFRNIGRDPTVERGSGSIVTRTAIQEKTKGVGGGGNPGSERKNITSLKEKIIPLRVNGRGRHSVEQGPSGYKMKWVR